MTQEKPKTGPIEELFLKDPVLPAETTPSEALLKEYETLRTEILQYQSENMKVINFGLLLVSGALTLLQALSEKKFRSFSRSIYRTTPSGKIRWNTLRN